MTTVKPGSTTVMRGDCWKKKRREKEKRKPRETYIQDWLCTEEDKYFPKETTRGGEEKV